MTFAPNFLNGQFCASASTRRTSTRRFRSFSGSPGNASFPWGQLAQYCQATSPSRSLNERCTCRANRPELVVYPNPAWYR